MTTMFDFRKNRGRTDRQAPAEIRRVRPPVTIGFEQLEGREMLSTGVVRTIIPTESRPLLSMPRPYIGSINPEAPVSIPIRIEPATPKPEASPAGLWPPGGRFRWRGLS